MRKFPFMVMVLAVCLVLCTACTLTKTAGTYGTGTASSTGGTVRTFDHEVTVPATNFEYRVAVTDTLDIGCSKAFECVGIMAHLAGYQEFGSDDRNGSIAAFDEYFAPYLSDPVVAETLDYFKFLRKQRGLGYDGVASGATYLSPDCHSWRVGEDILAERLDGRCGDPSSFLAAVAAFYDVTQFETFYESNLALYKELTAFHLGYTDLYKRCINAIEDYYHMPTNKVFVSSSVLGGNYGMSFFDGEKLLFEPKFFAFCFAPDLMVHELSHPYSNPVAEKIAQNKTLREVMDKKISPERRELLKSQAYGGTWTYLIELLNRANTLRMTKDIYNEEEWNWCMQYNKEMGFIEIEELTAFLEKYENGSYSCLMDFEPELEQFLLGLK